MWVALKSKSTSWNPVERLVFPAPVPSYDVSSFPQELIFIPRVDGEKVPCIFLPFRHARFLVIYFHANAQDLGRCHDFLKIMRDLFQVHVLAVEYPGYGICPGPTDEAGIMANAQAAATFATDTLGWPCDGIKLFGRSLGTGPCMALATKYNVAGVILVSPFTSIRNLFRAQVGPLADFVEERFENERLAAEVGSPTLIVHGQQDPLIPIGHGKVLYNLLTTRKMMVCPASMGHNTSLLKNIRTFVLPMLQFFSLPDYTFEDIDVPSWAFPAVPAPTGDPAAAAAATAAADGAPAVAEAVPEELPGADLEEPPDVAPADTPRLRRERGQGVSFGLIAQIGAAAVGEEARRRALGRGASAPPLLAARQGGDARDEAPPEPPLATATLGGDAHDVLFAAQQPYLSPRTTLGGASTTSTTAADSIKVKASRHYEFSVSLAPRGRGFEDDMPAVQLVTPRAPPLAQVVLPASGAASREPSAVSSGCPEEILDTISDQISWMLVET